MNTTQNTCSIDIYEVINNENVLNHTDYRVYDGLYRWYRKNEDEPLHGSFKVYNKNGDHLAMGEGDYVLNFDNGLLCDFTIFNDKEIIYWKRNDAGLVVQCILEDLVHAGRIMREDGVYLKFRYEYHKGYYKNQQNA